MLSTLLLVVTFLMSIFMIAQYFAQPGSKRQGHRAQAPDPSDRRADQPAVAREGQVADRLRTSSLRLQASLGVAKDENAKLSGFGLAATRRAKAAEATLPALTADLEAQKKISNEALSKVDL